MKKTLLAASIMSLCTPLSFSYAAEAVSQQTVTVLGTSLTEPVENTIVPVVVVTKADIQAQQANTLTEVLRQLPGVQLTQNGGYGSTGKAYVRGSSNVLFLLNGSRIGSATTGYADIGQIPLTGIQRIEYVRGARAAVYGADASAGVINIITATNPSKNTAGMSATGGSDQYQSYTGNASILIGDKGWLNLVAKHQQSNGFDALKNNDPDDDGFKNQDIVADLGYQLSDNWLLRLGGQYHDGQLDYDDSSTNGATNDNYNYTLSTQLEYQSARYASTFAMTQNKEELVDSLHGETTTERYTFSWRNNVALNNMNNIGFGAEYYNDDVGSSDTQYDETERYNRAGYLAYGYNDGTYQLESSVRLDDNEQFGSHTTWQLGLGWQFASELRLTANAGTGFKVPTFNDLYYPADPVFGGSANPNLQPEETTSYEVAIEGEHSWLDWRLSVYQQDIDNRIICQGNNSCGNDDVLINGVEWTGTFMTGWLQHTLSLEYLDPEDKSNQNNNPHSQATRIAKENVKWTIGYQGDEWQAAINYLYQGKRYDTSFGGAPNYLQNVETLDAYSLVGLTASYYITQQWTISGRIENLLDENYETVYDYNTAERSYYGTLAYSF
ncbi:MAG: TonB-dependent receptor domain-containing protein [Vibrio hibernica]